MTDIVIVTNKISKEELKQLAKKGFGDLVKAVVDVEKEIMALGGELHADEEALLLEQGSRQEDLWGINLYPGKSEDEQIEFNSMINIRPSQGNNSRGVESLETQRKIRNIISKLIL